MSLWDYEEEKQVENIFFNNCKVNLSNPVWYIWFGELIYFFADAAECMYKVIKYYGIICNRSKVIIRSCTIKKSSIF